MVLTLLGLMVASCVAHGPSGDSVATGEAVARPVPAASTPPVTTPRPVPAGSSGPGPSEVAAPGAPEISAADPAIETRVHRFTRQGIDCTLLTFDQRRYQLTVLDNAEGPGTGAGTAKEAAKTSSAVACINGGFFTPEGEPLGLAVENGTTFGSAGLPASTLRVCCSRSSMAARPAPLAA